MLRHVVRMPSARALAEHGPLLHVIFRRNPEVPHGSRHATGVRIAMLVDTGASCTMIDGRAPRELGNLLVRAELISGVTGGPELRPVYRMEMIMRMTDASGRPRDVSTVQDVVGMTPLSHRGSAFGLLGRDMLASMRLVYDGQLGAFSLLRASSNDG